MLKPGVLHWHQSEAKGELDPESQDELDRGDWCFQVNSQVCLLELAADVHAELVGLLERQQHGQLDAQELQPVASPLYVHSEAVLQVDLPS